MEVKFKWPGRAAGQTAWEFKVRDSLAGWLSLLSISHPSAATCWSGGTLDSRGTTSPLPAASKFRKCPQEGHLWPRFFPIYLSGSSEFWEQLLALVVRGAQDGTDCRVYNRNGAVHAALLQPNHSLSYLDLLKWFQYWPIDFELILWKSCCLIRWLFSAWQSCFSFITSAVLVLGEAVISFKSLLHI